MREFLVITRVSEDELGSAEGALGIYRLPRVFCNCPEPKRRNLRNWARGKKTGIPLCLTCKKPSRAWRSGIRARLEVALGKDIRGE